MPGSKTRTVLVNNMLIRLRRIVGSQLRRRVVVRTLAVAGTAGSPLNAAALRQIVHVVSVTRPDEIGCEACFEQLDVFVEITLQGRDAAQLLPLVYHHLSFCRDCREEFDALLAALQCPY